MFMKKIVHQSVIEDRSLHKNGVGWDILREASTEIVQHNHFVPHCEQVLSDMGTHETCPACYQRGRHSTQLLSAISEVELYIDISLLPARTGSACADRSLYNGSFTFHKTLRASGTWRRTRGLISG